MKEPEIVLKPSQWTNIGWIVFGLVGMTFILPPIIALYMILDVYCHRYSFYETHIIESRGVFNVTHNEVRFYRIKSIQQEEPLLFRIVGLSNIHIKTSDQYVRDFKIKAVPVGKSLVQDLRKVSKLERSNNKVREFDFYDM
jgi:uncharacterized membrane protein YdbT with pleckstrin-like domain